MYDFKFRQNGSSGGYDFNTFGGYFQKPKWPTPEEIAFAKEHSYHVNVPYVSQTVQNPKPDPKPEPDLEKARHEKALAKDTFLSLIYGRAYIDGKIALIQASGDFLYLIYVFGIGEIHSFESIYVDGVEINTAKKGLIAKGGAVVGTYLGTQTQGPDSTLQGLIQGYNDSFPGVAYLVVKIPSSYSSLPCCSAVVQGKLVKTSESGTPEFSTNPAYWLADFIEHAGSDYGLGQQADWATVQNVASACDEDVGGEPRRGGGFFHLNRQRTAKEIIDELRNMAGCWAVLDQGVYKLIPDRPVSSTAKSFNMDNILKLRSLKKNGQLKRPNAVQVWYTDTSKVPWTRKSVWAMTQGAKDGSEPFRPQTVRLEGIIHASEAKREAVERLNRYLNDLEISLNVFDEAIELQIGDVVEVTHDIGLTNKKFQLTSEPVMSSPGRWSFKAIEYDPAIFSDEVVTNPTYDDTDLPDPYEAPDVTGLTLSESLKQLKNGLFQSNIVASWNQVEWPFLAGYIVEVSSDGTTLFTAKVGKTQTTWTSPPVKELNTYTVNVRAYSTVTQGEATESSLYIQGKYARPADVPTFYGFEAGGTVHLYWEKPTDADIMRYELRYWGSGSDWSSGTIIDETDALTLTTSEIPEGTWTFGIKAVDSVFQKSLNPKTIELTVTMDTDAFKLQAEDLGVGSGNQFDHVRMAIVNSQAAVTGWEDRYYTHHDQSWASTFANAMNTYTSPVMSYCDNAGSSVFETDERDYGQDYGGNFIVTAMSAALVGSMSETQELRKDGETSATSYSQMSVNATARYQRYKCLTSGRGNVAQVTVPVFGQVNVIPRTEWGQSTSLSSGPKHISLERTYSTCIEVLITPLGSSAMTGVADNVDPSSGFDAYVFDSSGNQVSADFLWKWKGA